MIANENLRRLFDFQQSAASLIGKQLTALFAPRPQNAVDQSEAPCLLTEDVLFDAANRLKAVYGLPVSEVDIFNCPTSTCFCSVRLPNSQRSSADRLRLELSTRSAAQHAEETSSRQLLSS